MEWDSIDWYSIGKMHVILHFTGPLVCLVPMEYHLFHWHSIGVLHLIMRTYSISVGFRLNGGASYLSIGPIGTNGIILFYSTGIPLVKCISLWSDW